MRGPKIYVSKGYKTYNREWFKTYIMFSYGHDFIFRNPSTVDTLNIGNGHITHHLAGSITHCTVSIQCQRDNQNILLNPMVLTS